MARLPEGNSPRQDPLNTFMKRFRALYLSQKDQLPKGAELHRRLSMLNKDRRWRSLNDLVFYRSTSSLEQDAYIGQMEQRLLEIVHSDPPEDVIEPLDDADL